MVDGVGDPRADIATENANALLYGVFAPAAANQILRVNGGLILGNLAADPTDPVAVVGEMYYNTGSNAIKYYDGAWKTITSSSSLRYKHNIQPLVNDWNKILQIQPKSFVYNGDSEDTTSIGYIAEEFDALGLIDLVQYDDKGRPNGINYDKIALYSTEILKQQQLDINTLKQRLGISTEDVTINQAGTVADGQVEGVTLSGFDQSIKTSLANLGATLIEGVMSLKGVIADNAQIKTADITQVNIQKMQMVDQMSGEIYCTWIAGGEWVKVKGECANVAPETFQTATAPVPVPVISAEAQAAINVVTRDAQQAADQAAAAAAAAQQALGQANQANDSAQGAADAAQQAQSLDITSVASISDINVAYGQSSTLPTTISATLSGGIAANPAVTWDAGTPAFDANTAGTYVFSGTITLSSGVINTTNLKAAVNVIVAPQPEPVVEPPPAPENPATDLIQNAGASLINGMGNFIKWLIFTPIEKLVSLPIVRTTTAGILRSVDALGAVLVDSIKNLFGK